MGHNRPTLSALRASTFANLIAAIQGSDATLPVSVTEVLADVIAAGLHGVEGSIAQNYADHFPDLAEGDELRRSGRLKEVPELLALKSTGIATATGSESSVLEAGKLVRDERGIKYLVTVATTIVDGIATVSLSAVEAGVAGDLAAPATLTTISPVVGIDPTLTLGAGGMTGGRDEVDAEDYRASVVDRWANEPAGGNAADWESWPFLAEGLAVTRAWPAAATPDSAGVVPLLFVLDGQTPITPTAAQLATMTAHIGALISLGAGAAIGAPTLQPLDMTIGIEPDTPAVRAAAEAELLDLMLRDPAPGGSLRKSRLDEAVSRAPDETDHKVFIPADDTGADSAAHLITLGDITWVPL